MAVFLDEFIEVFLPSAESNDMRTMRDYLLGEGEADA